MKKKLSIKKLIFLIIFIISFIMLIISIINIIKWKKDNDLTSNIIQEIDNIVEVDTVKDNDNTEIIEQPEEIKKDNPYWDYIKMDLINVDFKELKNINNDSIGWIKVNGTNINYPFVQTTDNSYYLTHAFNKKYSDAGWVFADYRNNMDVFDKNTILYAHARLDKTMFGSLKNILKNGWLNDTNNYVVKLSTEKENTLWQVFSIYHIPTTNDYIRVEFKDNDDFMNFASMLLDRSIHNFNTTISQNDKILTLSTCYSNNQKLVLHAKLIKKETRS